MATESASFRCGFEQQQRGVSAPRVSAITGTYNGERFLRPAIESILNQTFRDFELIVIDDCSTDSTVRILAEFKDARLTIVRNARNLGIAETLNKGLALARAEYIALQDHDDVSDRTRFQHQVDFLDAHPDVAVVGSACRAIDESGALKWDHPVACENIELKWKLLFDNPFRHTSLMLRRRAVEAVAKYSLNPQYRFAEDYDLVSRIANLYRVANVPMRLVDWRIYPTSASGLNGEQQWNAGFEIARQNICRLLRFNEIELRLQLGLRALTNSVDLTISGRDVRDSIRLLESLIAAFYKNPEFSAVAVSKHRRRSCWRYGKRFVALSYRRNGKRSLGCRLALLQSGIKLLRKVCF
jgi:glycosyltransferase involved in cell wall biosynthesis